MVRHRVELVAVHARSAHGRGRDGAHLLVEDPKPRRCAAAISAASVVTLSSSWFARARTVMLSPNGGRYRAFLERL
jgi:hypothetical protein